MKYYDNSITIITPSAVYEAQRDGYKFIRLSDEQIDKARKANKELYCLIYETELKKVVSYGIYVKVSDLIDIAL